MAVVNKFNVNKEQVTLGADIIENMSANDVSYNDSIQYDENTVGNKLSELSQQGQQVIYDVTTNNDGVTFTSLSALLSSENLSTLIPTSVRNGGMSIRFVQSSDNKYVQYMYVGTSTAVADFINTDNWEKINLQDKIDYIENEINSNYVTYFKVVSGVTDEISNISYILKSGTKLKFELIEADTPNNIGIYFDDTLKRYVRTGGYEVWETVLDSDVSVIRTTPGTKMTYTIRLTCTEFGLSYRMSQLESHTNEVYKEISSFMTRTDELEFMTKGFDENITRVGTTEVFVNNGWLFKSGNQIKVTVVSSTTSSNIGIYIDGTLNVYINNNPKFSSTIITLTSDVQTLSIRGVDSGSSVIRVQSLKYIQSEVNKNTSDIEKINNRIFTRVTILGDSISTYQNYSTGGGYYPNGDSYANDVTSVDYTYWKIICDNLGYVCPFSTGVTNPNITNLSIAGSSVSSYSNHVLERTQNVKNSSLLIFAMGTNDYTHVEIGNFDYNTSPEEMSDSMFANAYIKNVKYLVNKYPDMDILCLSFGMGDDFANAIQTIAEHYGLMYLDLRQLLPNWEQHVHPNREEMHKVAVACMKHIGLYSKNISNKIASMSHYISLLEAKINELL